MPMIAVELKARDMRRAAAAMLESLEQSQCMSEFDALQATLIHGYVLGVLMSATGWELPPGIEDHIPTLAIGYREAERFADVIATHEGEK